MGITYDNECQVWQHRYDNHVLSLYGQHNATGKRVLIKFSEQNDVNLNTLIEWNTLEEQGGHICNYLDFMLTTISSSSVSAAWVVVLSARKLTITENCIQYLAQSVPTILWPRLQIPSIISIYLFS